MSQGNSLCSYFKQNCHFFFFYKTGEQEGRTGPAWGIGTSGRGRRQAFYHVSHTPSLFLLCFLFLCFVLDSLMASDYGPPSLPSI
jgi:hypothetical protein